MFRHPEGEEGRQKQGAEQQGAGGMSETFQEYERQAGGEAGAHERRGQNKCPQDKKYRLVAEQRVGGLVIQHAGHGHQDNRQQAGNHQRQGVGYPEQAAQHKDGQRLLPAGLQSLGRRHKKKGQENRPDYAQEQLTVIFADTRQSFAVAFQLVKWRAIFRLPYCIVTR